uniref:Uncharacterized protein n=1 Tax=Ixodes ricinus TaxID=34613 RepID=A0A6B0V093_IXORI
MSVPVSGALDAVVVVGAVATAGVGAGVGPTAVAIVLGAAVLAATADAAVGTAQPMLPEVDAPSSDFQRASDARWTTGADSLSDRLCLKRRTGCGCCCRRLGRTVPQSYLCPLSFCVGGTELRCPFDACSVEVFGDKRRLSTTTAVWSTENPLRSVWYFLSSPDEEKEELRTGPVGTRGRHSASTCSLQCL